MIDQMLNKLNLFWYWIRNVLITSKPTFIHLEYLDVLIDNKGVFLVSWNLGNSYRLDIPELSFQSLSKHSSTYISIPLHIEIIKIIISNSWSGLEHVIPLKKIKLDSQLDFQIKPNFQNLYKKIVSIPEVKIQFDNQHVTLPDLKIRAINNPVIKNLNYHQN